MNFDRNEYLPDSLLAQITSLRVDDPGLVIQEAQRRSRRSRLALDGRLVILAADHPGRGVTAAGGEGLAMADRGDYLARIIAVLEQPGIDGVMGTPDILDELLLISALRRAERGRSFLDEKVLVGSMNRGGLAGTDFEMMDRFTAYTPFELERMRFDGAKMMFRLDPGEPDSGSTIAACADALRQLEKLSIPAFLEPLPVEREEGKYRVVKEAKALTRVVGIASALGDSSRLLWLKIPFVKDYSLVTRATTCPILMLGGETRDDPTTVLEEFGAGLEAGPQVRGVLVGRNILFPGAEQPARMAAAVAALVHDGASPEDARRLLSRF